MDLLGHLLRATPVFKGKGRLTRFWVSKGRTGDCRWRVLPGGGARIKCDMSVPYESMVWLHAEEEADLAALAHILRPGASFVDCGANIGLWTLVAAAAIGADGSVYAFEPNPVAVEKLIDNVQANAFEDRVVISHFACGAQEGNGALSYDSQHNNSRLIENLAGERVLNVPVTTLDAALGGTKVHGIKIDVEGSEMDVLRGAENILKQSRPWLCVEFNTLLARVNRLSDWEAHQILSRHGYVCCWMCDAPSAPAVETIRDDLEIQGYTNLFYFVP